jgi:hypothetical protein
MTADQARDEMLAVFKTAWDTTGYAATYTDVPAVKPGSEVSWARVITRHETGGQTGFGASAAKKYTQTGSLFVQVFAPVGDGLTKAYELAQTVLVAFSQARGAVWYRKLKLREVGSDGSFEQINVIIDFTYDDQR